MFPVENTVITWQQLVRFSSQYYGISSTGNDHWNFCTCVNQFLLNVGKVYLAVQSILHTNCKLQKVVSCSHYNTLSAIIYICELLDLRNSIICIVCKRGCTASMHAMPYDCMCFVMPSQVFGTLNAALETNYIYTAIVIQAVIMFYMACKFISA